jgi:lipopolysaccharide transport system ATP-binding protein
VKPILEVRNVSKQYYLDHQQVQYLSLRDRISTLFKRTEKEEFWALNDVSFDVMPGDSLAIIGRNGAGKSTLLKILSRITPPTKGYVTCRGRMASLLEVGTGFHQELTGRENVFMNGSILGMKNSEINAKFDEIIDFSGVEKFLDTPLKNYSSGMQLRLAFAVAANLDPEILVIDEVLAVGDSEFQKKCMGKMQDVTAQGRTVLFVSHNMDAISQLCTRGILFKAGRIVKVEDNIDRLINFYLTENLATSNGSLDFIGNGEIKNEFHTVERFALLDEEGNAFEKTIHFSSPVWVHVEGKILKENSELNIGYAVYNSLNQRIYWSYCKDDESSHSSFMTGHFSIKTQIPARFLNQGSYHIELISVIHNRVWLMEPGTGITLNFEIADGHKNVILSPKFPWLNAENNRT